MPLWNKIGAFVPSEGGKHRLPPDVVEELESAIRSAALGSASFDTVGSTEGMTVTVRHASGYEQVHEGSVTDFIREKVRIHHDSWVIAPLQRILAWSLSKDDGSAHEYRLTDRLDSDWPNPETVAEMRKELERLYKLENAYAHFRAAVEGNVRKLEETLREQEQP